MDTDRRLVVMNELDDIECRLARIREEIRKSEAVISGLGRAIDDLVIMAMRVHKVEEWAAAGNRLRNYIFSSYGALVELASYPRAAQVRCEERKSELMDRLGISREVLVMHVHPPQPAREAAERSVLDKYPVVALS